MAGREILESIRKVWASAYNERALAYRRAKGISLDGIAVAVVVQRMVEARTSGVLFTANPNTGSVHEVVISSLWGAGEGLVSVGLDADTYVVDKETLEVAETLAVKTEQLILDRDAGGGLMRVPVAGIFKSGAASLARRPSPWPGWESPSSVTTAARRTSSSPSTRRGVRSCSRRGR